MLPTESPGSGYLGAAKSAFIEFLGVCVLQEGGKESVFKVQDKDIDSILYKTQKG